VLDLMLVEERWFIVELNPYREAQDVLGTTSPLRDIFFFSLSENGHWTSDCQWSETERGTRRVHGLVCLESSPYPSANRLFSILPIVAAASPKIKGKA
jgi:hypothetical protein